MPSPVLGIKVDGDRKFHKTHKIPESFALAAVSL
jgi:hypothetical protein